MRSMRDSETTAGVAGGRGGITHTHTHTYIYIETTLSPHSRMADTLLFATANPPGIENHHGLYLNPSDIQSMVTQIETAKLQGTPIPVHVEHVGLPIGTVISAWESNGRLDCVLSIDNSKFEGSIGSELVRAGLCKDLSLGCTVSLENSKHGVRARSKTLKEISIVKRGARANCKIHGIT